MMNLGRVICDMENSLIELKGQEIFHTDSEAFREYVSIRSQELEQFKKLVGNLEGDTTTIAVTAHLKSAGADLKYVGMLKNPKGYFQITPKLKALMHAGY